MSRIIFHIDVNSAFLSWSAVEKLKNGSTIDLRTIPAIVGGDSETRHGIVLAKSIPAKQFAIHTGEPVAQALKKCPTLIIEPPNHALYKQCSQKLMEYLRTFTPDIEQVSVDECYLDFTPIAHQFASPYAFAELLHTSIPEKFGFTVNIGIAPNKLLAKMASDFQKPDRIHTLFHEEIPKKMWSLPVEELFMTGKSSVARLKELGIFTIGDLAHTDCSFLVQQFKSHGKRMWEYANGIDDTPVISEKPDAKCIGNSVTLKQDLTKSEDAKITLLSLAESVCGRLRKAKKLAQSITVEIRYNDFTNVSHQCQLYTPSNNTDVLYQTACQLFEQRWNGTPIRLLGIRSGKLLDDSAPIQLSLFDEDYVSRLKTCETDSPSSTPQIQNCPKKEAQKKQPSRGPSHEKLQRVDAALDSIRKKYGDSAVIRGSLLSADSDMKYTGRGKK
ncbi:MAG: DNA polymerase IV [Lachnospiraceae bacterium]